ncbi:MAG: ARPP-1 family domain-containing protein, partial [Betaproteobacteria bacterium]
MTQIRDALAAVRLGAPQVHRNLALFPLASSRDQPPGYLLLDEALERKLARVTEVSEAGRVPELAFENGSAEKILLVDGDELAGAKQNRIVNLSILVGAGQKLVIPVSCVEQGRWSYRSRDFAPAHRTLFAKARAKKAVQVSESLMARRSRDADQGEIWSDVSAKLSSFQVDSDTGAMSDAYLGRSRDLQAYAGAFRPEPRQRGAVVAIDGRPVGLELFDSAAAFSKYLPKLVRSYALDALETANGKS